MIFPVSFRLVVLISGNGTNLQAIIDACHTGYLPAQVVAVVSNKADAYGLKRAALAGIPTRVLPKYKDQDRLDYDRNLAGLVSSFQPDWVILAGWMRLLSASFLNSFPQRVVNLHPALPGEFPGTDAIQRAFQSFKKGERTSTGIMVHLVPDEGVDDGPLIAQEKIPIFPDDTLEKLEERVHLVEHRIYVDAIKCLLK